ncbi:hypothetical protein TNCV_2272361 [Trichonephila clavipes]|nr:hypothetical protein TNCV_2272361 [Trichonephila clavipes]
MNLPTPSQRFNKKESELDTVVETVATVSMQIAAKEAKDVSGHSDIPVVIDVEVSGAIEIFQRSESLQGLRYTKLLGYGDARAYKAVNEMKPYGNIGIEKLECVGYVEKWMGTRLRALKLKMKGKKLSDKKTLDDHGRLADAEIDKLQSYYGLTIRNNTGSINSINSMYR